MPFVGWRRRFAWKCACMERLSGVGLIKAVTSTGFFHRSRLDCRNQSRAAASNEQRPVRNRGFRFPADMRATVVVIPVCRTSMHHLRSRIAKVVVWAMLPLMLLSALPRMGCICANGQYKLFCERHGNDGCRQHDDGTATGLCSCCHKGVVTGRSPSKVQTSGGCCQRKAGSSNGPSVSQRCCKSVVVTPLLPPVLKSVVVPDLTVLVLSTIDFDFVGTQLTVPTYELVRNPRLPVPDLLIAHQIFLI